MTKLSVVVLLLILSSSQVFAKSFSNGYIQFELPAGWQCMIEGSEWVCQSNDANRKKEAIIILAAKKRGSQDNLQSYKKYLEQTKTYKLPGGKMQKSEMKSVKNSQVNGQNWIDALHLASEIPGFYTRYLATVKSDIGVAVTFSVTKSMYSAYKGVFDNVIASMRVFRNSNTKLNTGALGKGAGNKNAGNAVFIPEDDMNIGMIDKQTRKKKEEGKDDYIFFLILGAIAIFAFVKLKKKKK